MENNPTKLDKAVKISVIAGAFIVVLAIAYYFVIFLPKKELIQRKGSGLSEESEQISQGELKKKALEKISQELSVAIENNDIQKIYDNSEPSLISNIPRNKFITRYSKENNVSLLKLQSSEEKINENSGEIKISVFICGTIESTLKWANKNQSNEIAKDFLLEVKSGEIDSKNSEGCSDVGNYEDMIFKYEYNNENWKIVDIQPSERSLTAASYYYIDYILESNQRKQKFLNGYSYGLDNRTYAIKKYAIYLDNNFDELIYLENAINKSKGLNNQISSEAPVSTPSVSSNNTESQTNSWDEYKQKQQQQCQKDWNEYNVCLGESNAKMAEYNTCLGESSNPSSYKYGHSCFKPSTRPCFKPVCSY